MNRIKQLLQLISILLILSIVGCSGANSATRTSTQTTTVMLYTIGSGDLSQEQQEAINVLKQNGSTATVKYVVASGGYGFGNTNITQFNYIIQNDEINIGQAGPINESDTLSQFIQLTMKNYPADKYILIVSGHAGGINSGFVSTMPNQPSLDFSFLDILNGLNSAKESLGNEFNQLTIIGFDGCLMANSEVAAALEPYANYMVASQNFDFQWNTESMVNYLNDNPNATGEEIGTFLVDNYLATANPSNQAIRTMSLVDLSQVPNLVTATNEFALALQNIAASNWPSNWITLANAMAATTAFYTDPMFGVSTNLVDVISFADQVTRVFSNQLTLESAVANLKQALNLAVITKANGNSALTYNASGLSMYTPVIVYAATPNYSFNTTFLGNEFFASQYVNLVNSYTTYYTNESTNLHAYLANSQTNSGSYSSIVSNPNTLLDSYAAFGYQQESVLYGVNWTLTNANTYVANQVATFESSNNSLNYTCSTASSNSWYYLQGTNNIITANPVLIFPATGQLNVEINNQVYYIPVAKVDKNGNVDTTGFLVAEQTESNSYTISSLINFSSGAGFVTGNTDPIVDGESFIPMVYANINGGWILAIPNGASSIQAPLNLIQNALPLPNSEGNQLFGFFDSDVSGAFNFAVPTLNYNCR